MKRRMLRFRHYFRGSLVDGCVVYVAMVEVAKGTLLLVSPAVTLIIIVALFFGMEE